MPISKGQLFVVAAPSGGGKTSLVKTLLHNLEDMCVSVSHTTRPMRPGEKDGQDYFFVDESTFLDMVSASAFIEHAKVFQHYYGTSVAQIQERLEAGCDVLLDIDWQGAEQIRRLFKDSVSIFILPPSLEVLEQRLTARNQDDETVIRHRMQQANAEMQHYPEFDYLVINDDFAQATEELQAIVLSHRLKLSRQVQKQQKLLSFLLAEE